MKRRNFVRLSEILFAVFAIILAVMIPLSIAGEENASVINDALGTSSYRIEEDESADGEEEDTEYFTPTYKEGEEDKLKSDYAALAEEVEGEGIVMLKNDNDALPLAKGSKVSLFGQGSTNFDYNTSGSSSTGSTSSYATLKDAFEYGNKLSVNGDLWDFYLSSDYTKNYGRSYGSNSGYSINEAPYSVFPGSVTGTFSTYGDAAIVVITRDSGEGSDSTALGTSSYTYGHDGSYLSLSMEELDLLQNLTTLKKNGTFDSIIVLVNTALELQMDFLDWDGVDVDALLWVGNTGSHGMYAIASVLVGDVNPSGKSVDTYANDNFSNPAMASWGLNNNKSFTQSYSNRSDFSSIINSTNRYYGVYVEGIYVGYRYYETRYEDVVMGTANAGAFSYSSDVAFPFGYGLSYTTFDYSDFSVTENAEEETYTVSVTVTNSGEVSGKEVVEVYAQKPYTDYDKEVGVEKASVELVGYDKTSVLEKGESETVEITVSREQFKSYDSNGAETYILDAGEYYLTVGRDSHDAVNNILALKGYTTADGMDAQGDKNMAEIVLSQGELDTETYSVSSETGEKVTNQLDFADVNRYEGSGTNSVTYVSRSDWSGTFPKENVVLSIATETMQHDLQSNLYDIPEDGSEMPKYGKDNGLSLIMLRGLDYDDEMWDDLLDQMSYEEQALLVADGYHLTNAVSSVNKPGTKDDNGPTSVDGSVTGYCLPSEGIWAASFNDELIERIGNLMGDDCIMAGLQGLYAPGMNIHRTAFDGRAHEYYSEDPYLSGMAAVAEIKGIQDRGVIAYAKHYAFNNEETNRNGVCVWLNEQSAREIYLLPFEYSLAPSMGNSHAVMTSFNRAGCTWTSASSELLLNIARGEWGYEGFYITDASSGNGGTYMTYYDGIMAGTNLYDGTGTSSALNDWKDSPRFANMVRDSSHWILYNVCNYSAAMNGISSNTRIVSVTPWWQVLITTIEIIAIVLTCLAAVFYVVAEILWHNQKKKDAASSEGDKLPDNTQEKNQE